MGKHMGDNTKAKILVARVLWKKPAAISKEVKRPRKIVEIFLGRYDQRDSIYNNYSANKPKAMDERTERRLCRTTLNNRRATARQLKIMLELTCSPQTIRQTLKRNEIHAR